MKTDLTKILSIGGQPGLYLYLAQSNGGVVVESLTDSKRKWMGPSARMTSLSDISVYSQTEDEIKLSEVLTRMKTFLKDEQAPVPGTGAQEMAAFFEKVIPEYDKERFYPSHMKKILDWYDILKAADRLEFEAPEEDAGGTAGEPDAESGKPEQASKPAAAKTPAKASRPAATKAAKPASAKAPKPVVKHTTQK